MVIGKTIAWNRQVNSIFNFFPAGTFTTFTMRKIPKVGESHEIQCDERKGRQLKSTTYRTGVSRLPDPRPYFQNYEFLVETQDGKIKVITRLTEYEARQNLNSDPPHLTMGKGVIGPTGFFSFQQ